MKVKYKINEAIYSALLDIFYEAKEIEDVYDMARIIETENETVYLTCCKNKWIIGYRDGMYYFGYEGTRNGFIRAQPFRDSRYSVPRFYLDYPSEPHPVWKSEMELWICIREDYISSTNNDNGDDVRRVLQKYPMKGYDYEERKDVEFNYVCYELKRLLEYETTLPKNIVHPLDRIETLLTDEKTAVILRGRELIYPLLVIEYKNMYKDVRKPY